MKITNKDLMEIDSKEGGLLNNVFAVKFITDQDYLRITTQLIMLFYTMSIIPGL